MKTKASLLVLSLLALSAVAVMAADAGAAPVVSPDAVQNVIDTLAGKHGWVTCLLAAMGALRLIFKPIMMALENYVANTPSDTDDQKLAKFEASPIYRGLSHLLDYVGSVKLPTVHKAIK